jgi:multiple antibiotic resistance protein
MNIPMFDQLFNALVTLMVTIDPPGLAPLFLVLTRGMDRSQRKQVAVRASIISFAVLAMFALLGIAILSVFGITIAAFRVAGGFLLFYIAFEMIFERRQQRHEQSAETAITRDMIHNIAAFPLAIPLIAGPGAISATIAASYLVFLVADRVDKFLGQTGRSILTRLLGLILAALAVQFVADGMKILAA